MTGETSPTPLAVVQTEPEPTALAAQEPPAVALPHGVIAAYVAAYAGTWIAVQGPVLVSLPLRVEQIAPGETVQALSLVLTLGSLVALGSPLFGRLSDRTRSRFGRRRPWLVAGVLIGLAGGLVLAAADSVAGLVVGWCLVKLGCGIALATLLAVLVDVIPAGRRGTVAGLLGVCPPLGAAAGAWLVRSAAGSEVWMFLVPAIVAAGAGIVFAVILRERPAPPEAPGKRRSFLAGLAINPRRYPDFGWAWLSRFGFFLAVASVVSFQALYLRHGLDRPLSEIAELVAVATLAKTICIIAASLICGRLSDRAGRRKPFVGGAALLFAVGVLVVIALGTYTGFVVGLAITGLAIGTYAPVDLALVIDVLPNRDDDAAKDLGVVNLATTLPGSLAPAIAPLLLMLGSGSYAPLFIAASVFALLAACAIAPIRGVR